MDQDIWLHNRQVFFFISHSKALRGRVCLVSAFNWIRIPFHFHAVLSTLPIFAVWPHLCVGKLLWLFQSYIKHLSDILFKSQRKFQWSRSGTLHLKGLLVNTSQMAFPKLVLWETTGNLNTTTEFGFLSWGLGSSFPTYCLPMSEQCIPDTQPIGLISASFTSYIWCTGLWTFLKLLFLKWV